MAVFPTTHTATLDAGVVIDTVTALDGLRARIGEWRRAGLRIGFVPTMGNLHAGHYSLLALARTQTDRVVASIFVNPAQFGPDEDFARYPRTPQADAAGLAAAGCDLLWLPSVESMYPHGVASSVEVRVPGITAVLEGAHRPGHFDGVATVVTRLFNQVQPDVAVFGRKDYQQLAVIGYLVRDLACPVQIMAGDTLREPDGLAMSSRNQYLSSEERTLAPELQHTLHSMCAAIQVGQPRMRVERDTQARLNELGFQVDYAVVRRADLSEPDDGEPGPRVALIAAKLGGTRLIDNLQFQLD